MRLLGHSQLGQVPVKTSCWRKWAVRANAEGLCLPWKWEQKARRRREELG